MLKKYGQLIDYMSKMVEEGICIAFSGGVDSSLLLKIATNEGIKLDKKVHAVTFETELHPPSDIEFAKMQAEEYGVLYEIIHIDEFAHSQIVENPVDRCYKCKSLLFTTLKSYANKIGISNVVDGTNFDDLKEYRPGLKALKELDIISPLAELEFTKEEIRNMAKMLNVKSANRPSAPCLATRIPYGDHLDRTTLIRIDKGEGFLKIIGFKTVRIRVHGDVARIEIDKNKFDIFLNRKDEIIHYLKKLGFIYITLDMDGFRSGSMDINVRKGQE